jgi:predicted Fe-Mo cluster-binding NifX family protein
VVLLLSACLMILLVSSLAAEPLKIAVASAGEDASANVGPTATRSPYYLIFDSKGKLVEIIENSYMKTRPGSGACLEAMKMLAGKGVTHVIAGAFGQRTSAAVRVNGMKQIYGLGTVQNAILELIRGKRK